MATKTTFGLEGKDRDSYLALVMDFPLASIKLDDHLAAAQVVMDRWLVRGKLDLDAESYLDTLSDLAATYEEANHAIGPASDADMLRHLLEAKGITQAELCKQTGVAKSSLSEMFAGRKSFSRPMIRKLADYFGVDVGVLAANH